MVTPYDRLHLEAAAIWMRRRSRPSGRLPLEEVIPSGLTLFPRVLGKVRVYTHVLCFDGSPMAIGVSGFSLMLADIEELTLKNSFAAGTPLVWSDVWITSRLHGVFCLAMPRARLVVDLLGQVIEAASRPDVVEVSAREAIEPPSPTVIIR